MDVYPVIWKARGSGPVAGGLELGVSSLTLHGRRTYEHRIEIDSAQIDDVGRASERVGRLPAIRLSVLGSVGTVLIAALGAGLNGEILDRLEAALGRVVAR